MKKSRKIALVSLFALFLFCLLMFLLFPHAPILAEFFARDVGSVVRWTLSLLSSPFPFSLFEILVALFVLYLVFLVFFALICLIRRLKNKPLPRQTRTAFVAPLLVLVLVFDLFTLTLAPCYHRPGVAEEMGLDTKGIDEEAVFGALEDLCAVADNAAKGIPFNEAGESLSPYTLKETKTKVNAAADRFGNQWDFFQATGFPAKSFLSSPLLTYTHISGVWGFFTGEANVNTNYPHFIVTPTLAHETCHARGIGPENEANFLAAVILMEDGDPYLAWCGSTFLIDDFLSLCLKLDGDRCRQILADAHPAILKDARAYSRFFEPYRDSDASKIADKTNSAYLVSMGQSDGVRSYSRIIALTSAYFAQKRT